MSYPSKKVAIFIDGPNLYATSKTLGFDLDFRRLLTVFESRGQLVRAFYYTAIIEDQECSSVRPLVEFIDAGDRRKIKAKMDIELAVHAMGPATHVDEVILFSGDGDFRPLVAAVQWRGVRVTVVSSMACQPAMIADELRRQADEFLDLSSLKRRSDVVSVLDRVRAMRPKQASFAWPESVSMSRIWSLGSSTAGEPAGQIE
jgi:uncharacterized LabA/DUF88 family protein